VVLWLGVQTAFGSVGSIGGINYKRGAAPHHPSIVRKRKRTKKEFQNTTPVQLLDSREELS
jgi:hypothetical protein